MNPDSQSSLLHSIRPPLENKFNPSKVREIVRLLLLEELSDKTYDPENAAIWTKSIAEAVQKKIMDLPYTRYKVIVQIVIGEQKGAGVKMNSRCLWDSDTDNSITEVVTTDTMFCVAVVFGSYYY